MNILIIGSGGREHAIAMALSKSPSKKQLFALPGNPGISEYCECIDIDPSNFREIKNFAKNNSIDLVIVGPEVPICEGITDYLKEYKIDVFAPSLEASKLESSKKFTKEIAFENNIPTGEAKWFDNYADACLYLEKLEAPYVIKADGLAAGKGVAICEDLNGAKNSLEDVFNGKFGSGQSVLIEEFLYGQELSYFAITDGKEILPLIGAQDHKRLLDKDEGPNTGGMGAYCPPPMLSTELENKIMKQILEPTIYGLRKRGIEYKGVLFAGLMVKENQPSLIEYNIRFGDPETQALLMLMKSDFAELLFETVNGNINNYNLEWEKKKAITVVLANEGYPSQYNKNAEIYGIEDAEKNPNVKVFHAGTSIIDGSLMATGGRVLNVTSIADTLELAREHAYSAIEKITYKGKVYRNDIAWRALSKIT